MFDRRLRAAKDKCLAPFSRDPLNRLHPNVFTIMACVLGLAVAGAAARGEYAIALVFWVSNRFFDGLDGAIARATNRQTDLGGYLDIVLDHFVYAAIPLGVALDLDDANGYRVLAVLLATYYVNAASWMYLAALLEKRKTGAAQSGEQTAITMPTGIVEGTETIVFYTLFLLFPGHAVVIWGVLSVAVLLTACQRIVWSIREFTCPS